MRETKAKEERGSEGSGGGERWVDELTAIGEEKRDGGGGRIWRRM